MDRGSIPKVEAAVVREIDFSKLVHEYVTARDVQMRVDVQAPKTKAAAAA